MSSSTSSPEQGTNDASEASLLTIAFEQLADAAPESDSETRGWPGYWDVHSRLNGLIRQLKERNDEPVRLGGSTLFSVPEQTEGEKLSVDTESLDWRAIHAVRWADALMVTVPFDYEPSLPAGRVGLICRDAYWYVVLDRETVLGRIWPGGGGAEPKWWVELAPGLANPGLEELWSDSFLEVVANTLEATVQLQLTPRYRGDQSPTEWQDEGREWVKQPPTAGDLDDPQPDWP